MRKIVHIMLTGPVTDGWNYQDNLLTKYHKKLGYEVTIITSQWVWGNQGKLEKFEKTDYLNNDGIKTIRLPIKRGDNFLRKLKRYNNLKEVINSEKADIIFVHNVAFLDVSKVVAYLKKNANVRVFVDNHSDYSNSATSWISKNVLHKILWRRMAQKLVPFTEKFYGVLPARVKFLTDIYKTPKEKTELLVMGADDEEVIEAEKLENINCIRQKYGIEQSDFLIMTGGKIDKAKSQTLLLMEAVKRIDDKNIKLIVFGSVEDSLKERVMNLVDGIKIQYIGWIDSPDSYKYFAAADLVVFPGRHSVFWEQVVGQGIPMICKYWEGTTHVDLGGNVKFLYQDTVEEIYKSIIALLVDNKAEYSIVKSIALKQKNIFSYSKIAEKSLNIVRSR